MTHPRVTETVNAIRALVEGAVAPGACSPEEALEILEGIQEEVSCYLEITIDALKEDLSR